MLTEAVAISANTPISISLQARQKWKNSHHPN
jgi:hypothetical protein